MFCFRCSIMSTLFSDVHICFPYPCSHLGSERRGLVVGFFDSYFARRHTLRTLSSARIWIFVLTLTIIMCIRSFFLTNIMFGMRMVHNGTVIVTASIICHFLLTVTFFYSFLALSLSSYVIDGRPTVSVPGVIFCFLGWGFCTLRCPQARRISYRLWCVLPLLIFIPFGTSLKTSHIYIYIYSWKLIKHHPIYVAKLLL